jgi:hypothetical protein
MEISQGNSLCSYLYLKQAKMSCFSFYLLSFFFYKTRELESGTCAAQGQGWHQWEERGIGKWGMRVNMVQKNVYTCK